MAARKKTARRTSSAAGARSKAAAKKPAPRKAAAKPSAANPLEALARRIVEATTKPGRLVLKDLYTTDCESQEATGDVHRGYAGLEEKGKGWEKMQRGTVWKARNVLLGKNTICIEWDARVTLNDGRVVPLPEVAIHEIRGGRIARERYYYNPMALMPPQA